VILAHEAGIEGYDIIGDVHGCHDALVSLLERMDYRREGGVYRCRGRKAVFLGDMIDRGPAIVATTRLVREMVDAGEAWCVLGNHEYQAISQSPVFPLDGDTTRSRSLGLTLRQFAAYPGEWNSLVTWMRNQPLCLEFPHFRAVHACWDTLKIDRLRDLNPACRLEQDDFLARVLTRGTEERRIVERILKGVSLRLPEGFSIRGRDGVERDRFRSAFWHPTPRTWGDVAFQPDALPAELLTRPLSDEELARLPLYGEQQKPLFVGHYWRNGTPSLLTRNVACLDYSAVRAGSLVAYRMGRESSLDPAHFVWVTVDRAH
jgi:hypothetical protein